MNKILVGALTAATVAGTLYLCYCAVRYGAGAVSPLEARIRAHYHARTSLDSELDKILTRTGDHM